MIDKPLDDEVLYRILDDLDDDPIPEYRTPECPAVLRFAIDGNEWTRDELLHIDSCPRCGSRQRAAQRLSESPVSDSIRIDRPSISKERTRKLFYFTAMAASHKNADPLLRDWSETFDGVEFAMTTRRDRFGHFIVGSCTTQPVTRAKVIIEKQLPDTGGTTIAEVEIEFLQLSGKWCGEAEFRLAELQMDEGAFSLRLLLEDTD